jgi:glycosyltransferase involved in cell wall biosynthesis
MGIPVVFTAHDTMTVSYTKLTHFVEPSICGVRNPDDYRLPPLANLRQNRLRYNPIRNPVIRHILTQHVQVRVAVSHELKRALEANDLPEFEVVHNGIPAVPLPSVEMVEQVRERLGLAGHRVILFAGRLTALKGCDPLLAAMNEVVQQVPNIKLLVLSSAPFDYSLLNRYENISANHIQEGGWLQDAELTAAYHCADVVVVPSIYLDPFPTVNLEAMAVGKPLITTCYGGSPEAVVDGESGYVINPFDTTQFSDRLMRILKSDSSQLTEKAYQHFMAHFTLARQVQQMEQIFLRVLN